MHPQIQILPLSIGRTDILGIRILFKETRKPHTFSCALREGLQFCFHKTLRTTPAMAAGITKRLWEIGEIGEIGEIVGCA